MMEPEDDRLYQMSKNSSLDRDKYLESENLPDIIADIPNEDTKQFLQDTILSNEDTRKKIQPDVKVDETPKFK